jgi:hypothetical protein
MDMQNGVLILLDKQYNKVLFDADRNELLDGEVSDELIAKASGSEFVILRREGESTIILRRSTGEEHAYPGDLGEILIITNKYLVLYNACSELVACIDRDDNRILWKAKKDGVLNKKLSSEFLVFDKIDYIKNTCDVTLVNVIDGVEEKKIHIDFGAIIIWQDDEEIIFCGSKIIENKREVYLVYYHIKKNSLVTRKVSSKQGLLTKLDGYLVQHNEVDMANTQNGKKYDVAEISAYHLDCGDRVGSVKIKNASFSNRSVREFGIYGDKLGCFAQSNMPWLNNHDLLVLWDRDDFSTPNPQYHEESLISGEERIESSNGYSYRIFVGNIDDNYFKLYRHLSVALYKCAAKYGNFFKDVKKECDNLFIGQIQCDVSNHELCELKKLAIKNMCKFVECKLKKDGFGAGVDAAINITIEPRFSE